VSALPTPSIARIVATARAASSGFRNFILAITSYDPTTASAEVIPSTERAFATTSGARPSSVWIKM